MVIYLFYRYRAPKGTTHPDFKKKYVPYRIDQISGKRVFLKKLLGDFAEEGDHGFCFLIKVLSLDISSSAVFIRWTDPCSRLSL